MFNKAHNRRDCGFGAAWDEVAINLRLSLFYKILFYSRGFCFFLGVDRLKRSNGFHFRMIVPLGFL